MGARGNEAREGGGGACLRGPWKSFPAPYTITWQPLRDLPKFSQKKIDLAQTKRAKVL